MTIVVAGGVAAAAVFSVVGVEEAEPTQRRVEGGGRFEEGKERARSGG